MQKITKASIIISSLGRTGTSFLANFFQNYYAQIAAFHEPGLININKKSLLEIFEFILENHFINLGTNNIRKISNQRLNNTITKEAAAEAIIKIRKDFIEKQNQKIYLESSYHFASLIDTLPLTFEKFRAIYIIRDPRDWVRSWINVGKLYSAKDLHYLMGNRPSPRKDSKEYQAWKKYNRFEKLCWLWQEANSYALNTLDKINGQYFLFEDLFKSKNKIQNFKRLINFSLEVSDNKLDSQANIESLLEMELVKKKNIATTYAFPKWKNWNPYQARKLDKICGKLMHKLKYGREEEWKNLLSKTKSAD